MLFNASIAFALVDANASARRQIMFTDYNSARHNIELLVKRPADHGLQRRKLLLRFRKHDLLPSASRRTDSQYP